MTFAYLLIGLLVGYRGYREAAKFEDEYGRSPWGLSPIGWGALVFFTGFFIGAILLWRARRATEKQIAQQPAFATPPQHSSLPTAPVPACPPPPAVSYQAMRPHPGSMDILPG